MKANEIINQHISSFHKTNLGLLKKREELIEALKNLECFHLNISSEDIKKVMNAFFFKLCEKMVP